MTENRMALLELAEKHAEGNLLRELGQFVLQRLMELDAESLCGAGKHERSAERVNRRNGYRWRALETRLGSLELKIPKLRSGSYLLLSPGLSPRRFLALSLERGAVISHIAELLT